MAEEEEVLFPRFFKVFLSETSSESLAIPMSFMEHLHSPLPKKAKLQGAGGGVWTVGTKKIREQAYFTEGWSKFAEDHELKSGEFLMFVYDGHHVFEVILFGHSGCKETRAVADTVELSDSDEVKEEKEEEDEDTSMDDDDDDDDDEISQSLYSVDIEETETDAAVVAGSSNLNPHFKAFLNKRLYELLIPANVVKKHNLRFKQTIKYIDREGMLQGQRGKFSDDRVCFKGWDRICRRNKLKKGDSVDCEILHTCKLVHAVKIHV